MSIDTLKLARQLLWRYRHETPIGNQPYMICQEVDEAFETIDQAIEQDQTSCYCLNCEALSKQLEQAQKEKQDGAD